VIERVRIADLTTDEARAAAARGDAVVLVPVGSTEPHGPHLPLGTDVIISEEACERAVSLLAAKGVPALVAPSVAYGVTDFAAGFTGAIGVPADVLTALLRAVVERFLADGFSHVCLVNNHLEPAHDAAVRASIAPFAKGRASVACPLTKRWARTLSDEFKRGDCHAGRYETSLVLAAGKDVREEFVELPTLGVSLSDGIRAGQSTFRAMGMDRAYTGAPALAAREEGDALYARLAEMIATEVVESASTATSE
jgi:creatinine amidohydrolase